MRNERRLAGGLLLALLVFGRCAGAQLNEVGVTESVPVDLATEIDKVAHIPERFAVEVPHRFDVRTRGQWQTVNGARVWHYVLNVPGAVSLSFHGQPLVLPKSAVLRVVGVSEQYQYTARDIHHGELWSRIARGDTLSFTLTVDPAEAAGVRFELTGIQAGFRTLGAHGPNHPHYDALRRMALRSAATTTSCVENFECHLTSANEGPGQSSVTLVIANVGLCSGVLLNDVPGDGVPYVLTARHCENGNANGGNPGAAASVVTYFDATTPCGQTLGTIYSANTAVESGATTVVEQQDAWLIRLDGALPVADAFYSGWDATGGAFIGGYTAHYAEGDARQFTGWYGQAYYQQVPGSQLGVGFTSTFWELVNQIGSIAPGASGSGVFDDNDRLVGTVVRGVPQSSQSGSPGVCPVVPPPAPSPKTFTALATALSGIFDSTADPLSTTGAVTLRSVLDPKGSGALVLDGQWQPMAFSASSSTSSTGSPVTLTWSAPGATSCTASGGQSGDGWSGPLATSGSLAITEFSAGATVYKISCPTTSGHAAASQVTITWSLATPAATLTASAPSTFVGAQVQLSWSSTVSPCTASGGGSGDGWVGTLSASGTQTVTESTAGTFTYVVTCGSGARTASAQAQFTFVAPSATLSDHGVTLINIGQPITLTGTGNGLSCSATGGGAGDGWQGIDFLALGGVYTLTEQVPGTYTYILTCSGYGTSVAVARVTVTFSNGPPHVSITATPSAPIVNSTFLHVSWVASVAPCTLAVTGYQNHTLYNYSYVGSYDDAELVVGPYTYKVTCGTGAATASASTTVNWVGTAQVLLLPYVSTAIAGEATPISWISNAVPCTVSGGTPGDGWSGTSQAASGSLKVTESQPGTYTYSISCGSGAESAQAQASVTFNKGPVFLTLTQSSTTGALGGTPVTLTWNSNTSPCAQSGGSGTDAWRQSGASSGSVGIMPADPGTYTYYINCGFGGPAYVAAAQASITFTGPSRPTFTTSTTYANAGQPFTLSWQSSDGSTCTALLGSPGDGWSGALPSSGSQQIIETVPGPYAYQLKCGVAGIAELGVEVDPAPPVQPLPPPTSVQLSAASATVFLDQNVSLTWSTTGATSCTASGGSGSDGWYGPLPMSGSRAISETTPGSYTYSIDCAGTGTANAQTTVQVDPPPTVTLSSNMGSVTTGQSFTLSWTSSETQSCNASGGASGDGWQGSEVPSGTATITESAQGSYTYTLTCSAGTEHIESQTEVTVNAARSSSSGGGGGGGGGSLDTSTLSALGLLALRAIFQLAGVRFPWSLRKSHDSLNRVHG